MTDNGKFSENKAKQIIFCILLRFNQRLLGLLHIYIFNNERLLLYENNDNLSNTVKVACFCIVEKDTVK